MTLDVRVRELVLLEMMGERRVLVILPWRHCEVCCQVHLDVLLYFIVGLVLGDGEGLIIL